MKNRYQALYKQLLFRLPNTTPALKTYAIVDSIRDESVKEKIPWSGLNHLDLWHEELWEHELEVPLYLLASYFISPYRIDPMFWLIIYKHSIQKRR